MAAEAPGGDPLAQRLEEAQLELQRLQDLVAEVPELMEQRFRQELHQVTAFNQALAAERQQLLAQLQQPASPQRSLPGAALPRPTRRLAWLCVGCVAVGAVALGVTRLRLSAEAPPRLPASAPPTTAAVAGQALPVVGSDKSLVELESSEPTWVEVSDRRGQLLLKDTVSGGDHRRIRLRNGLQLFAARPEVLRFRVDEGPWQAWPKQAMATGVLELVPRSP